MTQRLFFILTALLLTSSAIAQVSIHEIQFTEEPSGDSPHTGEAVTTGGIVTAVDYQAQTIRYFIADREGGLWSGVLVSDIADRGLSIGDSVQLDATVRESSGNQTWLRSVVFDTYIIVPGAGSVSPMIVTTGDIGEATEGVLVEIADAEVIEAGDVLIVDDGSGPVMVGDGWATTQELLVGDILRFLRGIATQDHDDFLINPRSDADFGFFGNRPPIISNVQHTPESVTALDPVHVTANIIDDSGVASAWIRYRFGETGEFAAQEMFDDGSHDDGSAGDGIWGGTIPAGPERTLANYYVLAVDGDEAESVNPSGAPEEIYEYLIRSATLTIFDIQYTGDPTGGASPFLGEVVTVTGIVTGEDYDGGSFFMTDPGGGPWSGVLVFNPPGSVARGDCVRVTAEVQEYFDLTELGAVGNVTVLGRGAIPDPIPVRADILSDSAEAYEGQLISIGECVVVNTGDWMQYGQFDVRDSTGTGTILGDFGFGYVPVAGDSFRFIIGCGTFHSAVGWMIAPRDDIDLGFIDKRPPEVIRAEAVDEFFVNILFNEALSEEGIDNLDNYVITDVSDVMFPELHIVNAFLFSSQRTIQLEVMEALVDTHAFRISVGSVVDTSSNVLEDFEIGFLGFTLDTTIVEIADIYSDFQTLNNSIGKLRGIVSFVQDVTTTSGSRRISAYMQDGSGRGFSLSQTGAASLFPNIQRGNLIEITGVITAYEHAIQLGEFMDNIDPDIGDVRLLSENVGSPVPIELRTGDLRVQRGVIQTSSEGDWGSGTWCRVSGTIYRVDENVGGGTNIAIDDGSGNLTIRVWNDMGLDSVFVNDEWVLMRDLVGRQVTVEGPSSVYNGDFQMLAGYSEDFTTASLETPPSSDVVLDVPNRPFAPDIGQTITISYNAPAIGSVRLRLYNMRGQLVKTFVDKEAGGPGVIQWDGRDEWRELLPLGTYVLHLEHVHSGDSKTEIKPIVVGTKL